jgi:hypothetical protein
MAPTHVVGYGSRLQSVTFLGALLDTVPARGLQAASRFERIKTKPLAGGRAADGEAA